MPEEQATTAVENADDATETVATPETEQTSEATSTEDAASETADETKDEATEVVEKPKPDLKQRKIAKQARELREMKRQTAQLNETIRMQAETASRSQKEGKAPKIEDFEDMASFLDARDDYRDSKREKPAENHEPNNDRDDLSDLGVEKYDDFEEVVFSDDVKVTREMADAIFEIDNDDLRVDVAYYLGNNPKEAARISKLSERRQIAEVAKIEMKVSSKPEAIKKPSKAPAPIKPVGGSKTTSDEIQSTESYESFLKKRNKQLGRSN